MGIIITGKSNYNPEVWRPYIAVNHHNPWKTWGAARRSPGSDPSQFVR